MSVEQLEKSNQATVVQEPEYVSAPQSSAADQTQSAERAMSYALVLSAVRCTLQYVVFPFLLPLLGIAGDVPPQIFVVINVLAMVAIISSVRRFWRINYKYKWQYLVVGAAAMVIQVAFTIHDLQLSSIV
jgi:hypothetical protein